MSENFFDRQRAAVVRLLDAVRARTAAEAELTANYEAAIEKAEREASRARKSNAAARQGELGRIDDTHASSASAIERKYDAEQYAADRARDDRRMQTTEKFKAAEQRGRTEHTDRLWHVDSMLEAGEKAAKEQLEALQRKAAGGAERVAALWTEAEPALARGRVKRADVEVTGELPLPSDDDPITRMNKAVQACESELDRLVRLMSPRCSGPAGIFLGVTVAAAFSAAASFPFFDIPTAVAITSVVGLILGLALWVFVRWLGRHSTLNHGKTLARNLAEASRTCRLLNDYASWEYAEERASQAERHTRKKKEANEHFLPLFETQRKQYDAELIRIETEYAAQTDKIGRQRAAETQAEEETFQSVRGKTERRLDAESASVEETYREKMAAVTETRDAAWAKMAAKWMEVTASVADTFDALRKEGADLFPQWNEVSLANRVPAGVRCGEMHIALKTIPDGVPADERLAPPDELSGQVPAFLPFPDRCSVLLRARDDGRAAAVQALQAMMLRFLTGLPAGKVRFTIIDPVGLGENFAAFMHLADSRRAAGRRRIWTEPAHIEQRLADLTEHMENVIQKYLRNQYETIEEYNAPRAKWPSRIACWWSRTSRPNFTPEAAKRLVSIASSGARAASTRS